MSRLFVLGLIVAVICVANLSVVNGEDNLSDNLRTLTSSNKEPMLFKKLKNVKSDDSDEKKDDSDEENDSKASKTSLGLFHAFIASISVIVVSEIGDKTFFIAAIMAMKHPRLTVYMGAMFALGLMTLLSALLGNIITQFIPKVYTYYASTFLFALFGLKMLHEGYYMASSDASDEYEEANSTLKESEEKSENLLGEKDVEAANGTACQSRNFVTLFRKYLSPIFLQAFILTFLAEWGDRSQISTIILGARENILGTVLGGTMGHGKI